MLLSMRLLHRITQIESLGTYNCYNVLFEDQKIAQHEIRCKYFHDIRY